MDTDYRLLRFIGDQPYPVTWYTIRAMNIKAYATPVVALRAPGPFSFPPHPRPLSLKGRGEHHAPRQAAPLSRVRERGRG